MSYKTFFMFTQGLSKSMRVPKGTLTRIMAHVEHVETTLGISPEMHKAKAGYWRNTKPKDGVSDEAVCKTVSEHNKWVRDLYEDLAKWSKTIFAREASETLSPRQAMKFWHALQQLDVPPGRWTADYYRERMEHLYEVMRGRPSEGVTFDAKALTEKQAAAVINLFSAYLDDNDLRLDVPNGHDRLASSYDGGYTWCDKCGPIDEDDLDDMAYNCRKRGCPIKREYGADR